MRVLVTGATGYIGSAVAEAFARRGHETWGLARSKGKASALEAREVRAVIGDMKDPASYVEAARRCEALVHCAADWGDYQALDRSAVSALLDVARSGPERRVVIYTSGVWLYGNTGSRAADESQALDAFHVVPWRGEHEKLVLASGGLVIRPGCVYGLRGGLTGLWFASALKDGAAAVAGDGGNRWATVHADDLGELYALAAESGLRGELFNATDHSRATVLAMAEAASRAAGTGGNIRLLPAADAEKAFGPMAKGMMLDQHVHSGKARQLLRWSPRFGGFADRAEQHFAAWRAAQG